MPQPKISTSREQSEKYDYSETESSHVEYCKRKASKCKSFAFIIFPWSSGTEKGKEKVSHPKVAETSKTYLIFTTSKPNLPPDNILYFLPSTSFSSLSNPNQIPNSTLRCKWDQPTNSKSPIRPIKDWFIPNHPTSIMAPFTTSHCFKALTFTILFLKTLAFEPIPLFSFADFGKDPKFKSNVALLGNAKVLNGGSGIQLSGSDGKVMFKRPVKLVEGKPRQLVSFSSYFAFSMSLYNRGGLAFVMVPIGSKSDVFGKSSSGYPFELKNKNGKSEVIGVEFSPSRDGRNWGYVNCNVQINVGNSVPAKVSNTSIINLAQRSDEKLHAWIDYVASSRRLEVRLSQHGNTKPSDPFLWHSIDLTNVLEEKEFFVGFSPVNGNESQACFVYSWSFVLRHFPHSMHSEPLDPKVLVKATETPVAKPRSDCFLRVLAAMIFGTGCGALTAFVVLYLWTIFGNRRPVVPEEFVMQPVDGEYRKVKIVVDKSKTIEDGKK